MDNQESNNISINDLPIYHWHNKEEGKEEYARFAKQFKLSLKHLCSLSPRAWWGPTPSRSASWSCSRISRSSPRLERRYDPLRREGRQGRRAFCRSPQRAGELLRICHLISRHIIDVATDNPPAGVPVEQWSYQLKFQATWETLRLEYQPSTVVDLSQLKDQIMALNDQMPRDFDQFKSEFHRLHIEILATQVPDAIYP